MKPLRIWARGYRTFDELDLTVPAGVTAIVGPNGYGKSSTINIIDLALFARKGELADEIAHHTDTLEIGLQFDHAGETYRVRRQLRRGKSATLDFERALIHSDTGDGVDTWEPLTREKTDETAKLIAATIGLSREAFRASAFMRQHDADAFTGADPADRKKRLAEILRLEQWDVRQKDAAAAVKAHEHELAMIAGRTETLEQTAMQRTDLERTLGQREEDAAVHAGEVETAEQALEVAQQRLAEHAATRERIRACEAELQTATADERRARDLLLEAQQAQTAREGKRGELDQARELAGRADEIAARLEEQRTAQAAALAATATRRELELSLQQLNAACLRAETERLEIRRQTAALAERVDHLRQAGDGSERCDRCEQTLGTEARQAALASMTAELAQLKATDTEKSLALGQAHELARAAEEKLATAVIPSVPEGDFETQLARARAAASRQTELEQLLADHDTKVAKLPLLQTELDQLTQITASRQTALDEARAAGGDIAPLEQNVNQARAALASVRAALDSTRRTLAALESQLEQVAQAEQELTGFLLRRETIQAEVDLLKLADRTFGRNGIPALLVEAIAVPQLEAEANRILELLPMADGRTFQLELRTQAENKSNDNIRETLDILVDDRGNLQRYEGCSGGEKMRINLAVRRALAQLLAHRADAETRFLAIDEPDGLDTTAMQALPAILEQLVAAGEFDTVLIVSHQPELATAFEQVLEVKREHGRSRIDTDARPEPVAA